MSRSIYESRINHAVSYHDNGKAGYDPPTAGVCQEGNYMMNGGNPVEFRTGLTSGDKKWCKEG